MMHTTPLLKLKREKLCLNLFYFQSYNNIKKQSSTRAMILSTKLLLNNDNKKISFK
jgi:hypothetical protein